MDIIIQSPGFKASEHLETFTKEKLNKLDHFGEKIIRADVTLLKEPGNEHNNYFCEIRLEVPGYDHFAKKNGETFEQAIATCVHALQQIIQKSKDKLISRHS